MNDATPFPPPPPVDRLTDLEVVRLGLWARDSTLPAWRRFDPALPSTPPDTIARLIAEWTAMRAVLDLIGEFSTDLGELLRRMNGREAGDD